jgi:hypothetical protein
MTYENHIVDEQVYYSNRFSEPEDQLNQYSALRDVFGTVSWSTHKDRRQNPVLLKVTQLLQERVRFSLTLSMLTDTVKRRYT